MLYAQVSKMKTEAHRTIPGCLPNLDESVCESPPLEHVMALQRGVGRHTSILHLIRRSSCEGNQVWE